MSNPPRSLRPSLVLGTGCQRWVLGRSMRDEIKPLLNRNELPLTVVHEMRTPQGRIDHNLTVQIEHLRTVAQSNDHIDNKADGRISSPPTGMLELNAKWRAALTPNKCKRLP